MDEGAHVVTVVVGTAGASGARVMWDLARARLGASRARAAKAVDVFMIAVSMRRKMLEFVDVDAVKTCRQQAEGGGPFKGAGL